MISDSSEVRMIIKYRFQVIDTINYLLIQEAKQKSLREEFGKNISQKTCFKFPKKNHFNKLKRVFFYRKVINECCNIFSVELFNKKFVKHRIRPIIKRMYLAENLEDLIYYSNRIKDNLKLKDFFK